MRNIGDDIELLADDENTIKDIIKQNWKDDSFVKQYRSKIYGKANFITFANVDREITEKYYNNTKYGMDWKTNKRRKSIRILLGALRRSKSGPVISVKENENGTYPPFIKVRRPSIDKYASDNILLYEFAGTRPIDAAKPKLGVMPIYKLVLPSSAQIKAGTYWYDMINPVNADPVGYDINTIEKLDLYFGEDGIVTEDVSSKKELLDKFVEIMDESGIYLNEDEMIERIKTEFDNHDYAIKPSELEKAVKFALKKLKNKDSEQSKSKRSTSRKQTETKEKKKQIESNNDASEESAATSDEDLMAVLSDSENETKSSKNKKKTASTKKQQKSDTEITDEDLMSTLGDGGKKPKKNSKKVDFKRDETYKSLKTTSKTPFEVDGIPFSSVYQYYQYKRIDFSDETEEVKEELRDSILKAQSYDEMRAISNEYEIDSKAWQKQISSVIKQGLIYAYSDVRNAKAKKLLLSTGDAEISTGNDSTAKAYTEARERLRDFDDSDVSEEAQNTCALKKKKK